MGHIGLILLGVIIYHHCFIGLLTIAALYFDAKWARAKETVKEVSCRYLKPDAWLVILITAIGTGGLFAGLVISLRC
jgi:nicotinamide riboside transporter PnuC